MGELAAEAIAAGALGFSTSRSRNHVSSDGRLTPTLTATASRAARGGPGHRGHGPRCVRGRLRGRRHRAPP